MNNINITKVILLSLLFFAGFFFTGCSSSAPKCSDTETTDLVEQITRQELAKLYGQEASNGFQITLAAIRTTDINDKTGAQTCAADVTLKGADGTHSAPITYTSELADKGDEFYVTVYGL